MTKPAPVLTVLCFSLLCIPSLAQESIGFSDSTDFQYIIDYRLPDWGYSNFYLENTSIGTNGELFSDEGEQYISSNELDLINDTQQNRSRVQLNLTPAYQYYRESENRTINVRTNLSINTSVRNLNYNIDRRRFQNGNTDTLDYDIQQSTKRSGVNYFLDYTGTHFLSGELFLLTGLGANIGYQYRKYDREHSQQTPHEIYYDEIERHLELSPRIGIGFGRLRNIAPQLRAIRLNERYKSLDNTSINEDDLTQAAEQFTKIRGYQRTSDRYEKYFWGDMNQLLSGNLDRLQTYDLLYLTDVLDENLGQRFEGFEGFLFGTFLYQNQLRNIDRTEDGVDSDERNINIEKNILTTAGLRWYKNLNLNHQLSFITENEIRFPLETKSSTEWILNSESVFSWLWTVTDRYISTTSLNNRIYKPKFKPRFSDSNQYNSETYLSSQLSYFIENKLAFTTKASFGLGTFNIDSTERIAERHSFIWSLSAGVRYYFDRNLF